MSQKTVKLNIRGMSCQGCADTVTRSLKKQKGVEQVSIDWGKGSGEIVINAEITGEEDILRNRVFEGHYSAELAK